jgi:hypothetical protein
VVVPLVCIPVIPDGATAVQLIVVFEVALVRDTAVLDVPEQMAWLPAENATTGAGFTVMVNVFGMPLQPFAAGVTVIVALIGAVPLFTAVNAGISPVPDAARPMEGVLFVQLNWVPVIVPE